MDSGAKARKTLKKVEKEIEKEILLNVPNSITLLRLFLTFLFIYMLFENYNIVLLFIVFSIAAVTDWFDGYFARKLKQTTKFGARMDQIVDRIFTIMIVLSIVVYLIVNRSSEDMNLFRFSGDNVYLMLFLVSSREIIGAPGVLISLIRRKQTYNVRYIGKVTTFIQSVTLGAIILQMPIAIFLAMITCVIGIVSGFDYLMYSLN